MLEAAIVWAKEYGDVLGSIGFLFALSTVLITNGRVIYDRFKTGQVTQDASSLQLALASSSPITFSPDYGNKTAIAVLPPSLLGQVDEHFAAGLVDDVIADLQKAGFVSPDVSSVARLCSDLAEPMTIAKKLKVNHILKTSIRCQENKYRVTVQLIDISGAIIWSDRYTHEGGDQMAIQESIAAAVAKDTYRFLKPNSSIEQHENGDGNSSRGIIVSHKSRLVALLLCCPPMGFFGVHRFYVGRPFTGALYLCTVSLVLFGWLIDSVLILFGLFADGKGKPVRIWRPDPTD